jgi:hypothetical protein
MLESPRQAQNSVRFFSTSQSSGKDLTINIGDKNIVGNLTTEYRYQCGRSNSIQLLLNDPSAASLPWATSSVRRPYDGHLLQAINVGQQTGSLISTSVARSPPARL